LADNLGTIRDIEDGSTKTVLYHGDPAAFGTMTEYGSGYGDRFKFTAREQDLDTGLQYNRARWYDISTGTWISEDSSAFDAGDANLHRYVGNGPTNAGDPSGLLPAWTKEGVIKVLKETATGQKTLEKIQELEKAKSLTIYRADMRYRYSKDPREFKGIPQDLPFNDRRIASWKISDGTSAITRLGKKKGEGTVYLSEDLNDYLAALTLVHELRHVLQGPRMIQDPKTRDQRIQYNKETLARELEAYTWEVNMLLDKPTVWITKKRLGEYYYTRFTTVFMKKSGREWVINKKGIEEYIKKNYHIPAEAVAVGKMVESNYAYKVNGHLAKITKW
jgi:RHS repeat-associated protein